MASPGGSDMTGIATYTPAPEQKGGDGLGEAGVKDEGSKELSSTAADPGNNLSSGPSTASLMEKFGFSSLDEKSLQALLKGMQTEVVSALEDLTTITTYDDNLEKQYKEVVSENTKLHAELEKARNEIRHLKGQLSITQMTSAEIREERARMELREKKHNEQERLLELQRSKVNTDTIYVPTFSERALTVNSKGDYVDHRVSQPRSRHTRSSTYPVPQPLPSLSPQRKQETLPPPLNGCTCSECNSKQSLGAVTLGKGLCQRFLTNQITKSGQQILLGDKVVVKGERLGAVKYIGKLDFDLFDQVYIGVHLDMPVGISDGAVKGRRYFQSPASHGVFVKPVDIICVTGRKPVSGGTAIPRVRERIPLGIIKRTPSSSKKAQNLTGRHDGVQSQASSSVRSESSVVRAHNTVESELEALKTKSPYDLVDPSVSAMSQRMKALSQKQRSHDNPPVVANEPATPNTTPIAIDEPDNVPVTTPSSNGFIPQPLPPIPERRSSTPRSATPLERTLLGLLNEADLGSTGFVTVSELKAVLLELGKLSSERVTDLLASLGVATDEGVGVPYHEFLPHLLSEIKQN